MAMWVLVCPKASGDVDRIYVYSSQALADAAKAAAIAARGAKISPYILAGPATDTVYDATG